jgi:DNA polymerase-1
MELKLNFNGLKVEDDSKEKRERAKAARQKKRDASETIEEALERVSKMSLTERELEQVKAAMRGIKDGSVGRLNSGKMTKGEALSMGKKVQDTEEAALREERIASVINNKPENYYILTDDSELAPFMERVREEIRRQMVEWKDKYKVLGVESMTAGDYEGTGVDTYIDLSIGFSIWLPILNEGYYLAYGHVDGFDVPYAYKKGDPQLTRSKVMRTLAPYLAQKEHGKTFHMGSARYDLHIAINDGIEIHGLVWDTLDAMRHLTENLPRYGLKPLTERYGKYFGMGGEVLTFEDLFGNGSPAPFNTEIVGIYAIKDVEMGYKLFEWQFEQMKKTDRLLECFANIDSKLPETDVFMARNGFRIDLEALEQLDVEFSHKIEVAKAHVMEAYEIDDDFIYNMNMTIYGKRIGEWLEKLHRRRGRVVKRLERATDTIEECENNNKTHLKKYHQALDTYEKAEKELAELDNPDPRNFPQYATEFEFTNNNHIGYLIYDFLEIEDKTPRVKRGKSRSTAADVLEMYYDEEADLKPLATVAEYEKLLNTYVRKIPQAMEIDGRFHTTWRSGGTTTGRYSSEAYNGRPIDILDEFIEED